MIGIRKIGDRDREKYSLGNQIRSGSGAISVVAPDTKVPFRSKQELADAAKQLRQRGNQQLPKQFDGPYVDVEKFVEKVQPKFGIPALKLNFESNLHYWFENHPAYSNSTVLAFLDFSDGSIYVDDSLDKDYDFNVGPKLRFTLAHELAHYQLHRKLVVPKLQLEAGPRLHRRPILATRAIFEDPSALMLMEWQANWFASHFLIPQDHLEAMLIGGLRLGMYPLQDTTEGRHVAKSMIERIKKAFGVSYWVAMYRLKEFRCPEFPNTSILPPSMSVFRSAR